MTQGLHLLQLTDLLRRPFALGEFRPQLLIRRFQRPGAFRTRSSSAAFSASSASRASFSAERS